MHHQHSLLWQREVEHIHKTRCQTQCLLYAMPSSTTRHNLDGKGHQLQGKAKSLSIFVMLNQRRLRWLGHFIRMEKRRFPKDLLYWELEEGSLLIGRLHLRFSDVCKRDFKSTSIDTETWEVKAQNRPA
mgnify:CR=1 FL=1